MESKTARSRESGLGNVLAVLLLTAALAGCMGGLDERVSAEGGAEIYAANCAVCHGAVARGADGSALIGSVAPDLTGLSQRNGGVFPEVEVLATIYGPAGHAARDGIMPEFGRGDLGPTVVVELEEGIGTPIPADLLALSAYLQSIQR